MPALAAALSAALAFAVQPLLARALLPPFGGSAAVWTVSLLFFQTLLLGGYAWAHVVGRWSGRRVVLAHGALLVVSLIWLPIGASVDPDGGPPAAMVLLALALGVGGPFLALSATAPLLQARAAAGEDEAPHRLYAWSNAGSIGGLLAWPLLLEPLLGVRAQMLGWSAVYVAFAVVMLLALRGSRAVPAPPVHDAPPTVGRRLVWLGLSAVGVALLMSITDAIGQDLTVTPVFWVVPLLLYLLTFVIAFGRERWAARRVWFPLAALGLVALVALQHAGWRAPWAAQLGGYCVGLFTLCMAVHGELVRQKPEPGRLTAFYLYTSAGGALGGLLVAVLSPWLFPTHVELPAALVAAWALCGHCWLADRDPNRPVEGPRLLLIAGAALVLVAAGWPVAKRLTGDVDLHRSFYGTLQVKRYRTATPEKAIAHLLDGRISHGFQRLGADRRREPTAYFAPHSGVGRVLSRPARGPRHVGIIGLGAGTLAAYARSGETFDFYELNPDVVDVARADFSFLADAPTPPAVFLGDGRRALAARDPQSYDLLAVDAFTGDAIPAHLITREAVALYLEHLAPEGVLAVNVSNRHAALARVVVGHAAHFDLRWTRVRARAKSPLGDYDSDWMLLGRTDAALVDLPSPPDEALEPVQWTDDFAPLWPILR